MASSATLAQLVASISVEKTRTVKFPSSLAVFGGAISSKKTKKPRSCRDQFVKFLQQQNHSLEKYIFVPENYDDWNDDGVYPDLLKFEEDLGYLTSTVLIFLEAPGAIAELGAFSQIGSLREGLIAVVSADHYKNKSFIKLGPLTQLKNLNPDSLCVIPFTKSGMNEQDLRGVIDQVERVISKKSPSQSFDVNNKQHQLLLTLDLISLAEVLSFEDLVSAREAFGISRDGGTKSLHQALFALEKVKLISFEDYKNQTYYLPRKEVHSWLEYTAKEGAPSYLRSRWQARFRNSIFENIDLRRVWEIHHNTELVA
jgi:hypothetical protein